jgi:hypothetical protein
MAPAADHRPDDEEDDAPRPMPARRRVTYLAQVGVYAAFAVAIPVYMYQGAQMVGFMALFTWLMAFYMAARALSIFVKYRQESGPPRYSRDYVEARDLLGGKPGESKAPDIHSTDFNSTDLNSTDSNDGSTKGSGHG